MVGDKQRGGLGQVASFFEQRGVSSSAALGFIGLVLLALVLLAVYPLFEQRQVRAVVLSGGERLDGALVEAFSPEGRLVASGVPSKGRVQFGEGLPVSGTLTLKASLDGFVAADGARQAIAVIDLAAPRDVTLELYSSEFVPGEFYGAVSLMVVDSKDNQPIVGASVEVAPASEILSFKTNASGVVVLWVPKGVLLRVRTTAPGFFADSRSFVAVRDEEIIELARQVQQVAFSGNIGEPAKIVENSRPGVVDGPVEPNPAELFMPKAELVLLDSTGYALQSGSVSVLNPSGLVVSSAPINSGRARLEGLSLGEGFSLQVNAPSSEGGSVSVYDALSSSLLLSTQVSGGSASLNLVAFDSLSVNVKTLSGVPVEAGKINVFDSSTGALWASAIILQGKAVVTGVPVDSKISLALDAQGFSAGPVQALFGRVASTTIVAVPVAADFPLTEFSAVDENGVPVAALVSAYAIDSSGIASVIPVVERQFSGSVSSSLAQGNYSAVFTSTGRYPISFNSFAAGSRVAAVLVKNSVAVTAPQCVSYQGVQSCFSVLLSPQGLQDLAVYVESQSGVPLAGALVSVRDLNGRTLFAAKTGVDGRVLAGGLPQGAYNVSASGFGSFASEQFVLSSSSSSSLVSLQLNATGTLLFSARSSLDGSLVDASFKVAGASCSGTSCALAVEADAVVSILVSAAGFKGAVADKRVAPGEIVPASFYLVPQGIPVSARFLGARNARGNPVDSMMAGQDYLLYFSLYGEAQDKTTLTVRLGSASSVLNEDYGLISFDSSAFDQVSKSTSFSPQPTCVDLNNNNPSGGLFKWVSLSFANQGAPIQKTVAIPVRVKNSASQKTMKIFYRAEASGDGRVSRFPSDPLLGESFDSPSKAGCYADSAAAEIAISLGVACADNTAVGECSRNSPLFCVSASNGVLLLAANQQCCAQGASLSQGLCVVALPGAGNCVDGTPENSCSQLNKPYSCQGGVLTQLQDCCAADEVLQDGLCRPVGALCSIGGKSFPDGACLQPGPSRCLNGIVKPDYKFCSCPQGQAPAAGGSCTTILCSDGTVAGQCSQQAVGLKCVAASGAAALFPDVSCASCPSGFSLLAGACVACATASCDVGLQQSCLFGGSRVSPGCIGASKPLYCNADGRVLTSPALCGCSEGLSFDASSDSCFAKTAQACLDGTPSGACSTVLPKQCLMVSGRSLLVENAVACGCPAESISDGVSCKSPDGTPISSSPSISSSSGQTSNNSSSSASTVSFSTDFGPLAVCANRGRCVAPEVSDEYCNSQGVLTHDCLKCSSACGSNGLLYCNAASGSCSSVSCSVAGRGSVPAGQCIDGLPPGRCVLSQGLPVVVQNSSACGCPAGFAPDARGTGCVQCSNPDCDGSSSQACLDDKAAGHPAGSCLPQSTTIAALGNSAPLMRCLANGTIVPDIAQCGCADGFTRSLDNLKCVAVPSLPAVAAATCPGCVANDTVFFNAASGVLQTKTGATSYSMQADTAFPADAMKLLIEKAGLPGDVSVKTIRSDSGSEACYSYNPANGLFVFKAVRPCPIEVRANSFYSARTGQPVSSDSVSLTLMVSSIPPKEIALNFAVSLVSVDSLLVTPQAVSGADTPQLLFVLNRKQLPFGGRTLSIASSKTSQDSSLDGPQVKVLAWRGPGSLAVSESGQELATLYYGRAASYFACSDGTGPRVESSCDGNPTCCAGGWCDGSSFSKMFAAFKQYSQDFASQTAFRRGNGEPWKTIAAAGTAFKVNTAAQVVAGSQGIVSSEGISLSTPASCSNLSRPGVYSIEAATKDGKSFKYSAGVAAITKFDYVDGVCTDDSEFVLDPAAARPGLKAQFLCDFLYGDCSCVRKSAKSILPTGPQNAPGNDNLNNLALLPLLSQMMQQLANPDKQGGQGGGGGGGGGNPPPNNPPPGNVPPNQNPFINQNNGKVPNQQQLKDKSGKTPVTPLDIKFDASKFRESCEEKSKPYVEAQDKADESCAPKDVVSQAGVGEIALAGETPRKGLRDEWIAKESAQPPKETVSDGAATTEFEFKIEQKDYRNNGEIVKTLDDCEKKPRKVTDKEKKDTLDNYCKQEVLKAVTEKYDSLSKAIDAATAACKLKCKSVGKCVTKCEDAAKKAREQVDQNLGKPQELEAALASKEPQKDSQNSAKPSCASVIARELSTGGACDAINALLIEDKESPLPPDPKKREAWATCYAQEGSATNGGSSGSGTSPQGKALRAGCAAVCQSEHSFSQIGVKTALVLVNRFGIGDGKQEGACVDRQPAMAGKLQDLDANLVQLASKKLGFGNGEWKTKFKPVGDSRLTKENSGDLLRQMVVDPDAYKGDGEAIENLINNFRSGANIPTLQLDPRLREYARAWATQLANQDTVGHQSQDAFSRIMSEIGSNSLVEIAADTGLPNGIPDKGFLQGVQIPTYEGGSLNAFYLSKDGHWDPIEGKDNVFSMGGATVLVRKPSGEMVGRTVVLFGNKK